MKSHCLWLNAGFKEALMVIGTLAVQGAFIEHEEIFKKLGADTIQLRQKND